MERRDLQIEELESRALAGREFGSMKGVEAKQGGSERQDAESLGRLAERQDRRGKRVTRSAR